MESNSVETLTHVDGKTSFNLIVVPIVPFVVVQAKTNSEKIKLCAKYDSVKETISH